MRFGCMAAGVVVAGWLGASAVGCAQADVDAVARAGVDAEGADEVGQQEGVTLPPTSNTTSNPFPWPSLTPRLDTPKATCADLAPLSKFNGYLIETTVNGTCPMIYSSVAQWAGDVWEVKPDHLVMNDNNASFFVGTRSIACRYHLHAAAVGSTEQTRYAALMTSLGYPSHVPRDMLGINCDTIDWGTVGASPPNVDPIPPLNQCRQCAIAHDNAVKL